jgi:hypothetical protein
MSRQALADVVVYEATKVAGGTIFEICASDTSFLIGVTISIGLEDSTPKIIKHHVLRGTLTAHDLLEFTAAAIDGAAMWLTSNKLLTKNDLISADDWVSCQTYGDRFWLRSPSLGVRLLVNRAGTLLEVEGCLIEHGDRFRRPYPAERWGRHMVALIIRRIAYRALGLPSSLLGCP